MQPARPHRRSWPRRARAGVLVALVAATAVGIPPVGAAVPTIEERTGIVWRTISGVTLRLDVYVPDDDSRARPTVLLVHGGGWRGGSRADLVDEARVIAQLGGVAISVDYRLAPEHPYPAAVDDVIAAVQWIRDDAQVRRYGIDTDRIVVGGVSAGGHLAAMVGSLGRGEERVAAVIAWSGIFDLRTFEGLTNDPGFLGCVPSQCPSVAKAASPIAHVSSSDPPMLLVTARRDQIVSADQARDMADALRRAGVDHELVTLPGKGHATQIAPAAATPSLEFLARTVFLGA